MGIFDKLFGGKGQDKSPEGGGLASWSDAGDPSAGVGTGQPVQPGEGSAAKLCDGLELDEAAAGLLRENPVPGDFIRALAKKKLYQLGVAVMARWLPKRVAVWWAILCVYGMAGEGEISPQEAAALEAAKKWVTDGSEDNRWAAKAAAEATEFSGPAAWVAMAAFWSGDSLAPTGEPPIKPDDLLASQAVNGAIMLIAVKGDPKKAAGKYLAFLNKGWELIDGKVGLPGAG